MRLLFLLGLPLLLSGCLSFHQGPLPGEPKNASFAQIGDTRVRYLDTGSDKDPKKPAVVMVHGFGSSIEEWGLLIPELVKSGYRVLALDLKGHGWSDRPDGDYSIQAQARLVIALADKRGLDRFVVVGHSWGSSIALAMALMEPTRVARVALYNGMIFQDQQPTLFSWARVPGIGEYLYGVIYKERADEKMAYAFYDKERHIDEKMVEALERMMDRPGTEAASLAAIRAMKHTELQARYKNIQQPVLLQWGREDQVTPLPYGERLLHELPHARLVVYPQCGHIPMLEVPGPSSAELLRFLAEGSLPSPVPPAAPVASQESNK